VTDREFWIAFRRWLKSRMAADQQMIAAIEQRFDIGDNGTAMDRQRPAPVLTR
jgi:hypothetical protein